MRLRPLLVFVALVSGSALGSSAHGCASTPAQAGGGGGGGTPCPPVTCTAPAPTPLTRYADILAALRSGARVRAVLDYSKCTIGPDPAPKALGAMNLDTFEWFAPKVLGNPKAYIAASETHLIHLQSGFVHNYARLRVFEDEKVSLDVKYVDPITLAVSVDETIDCVIDDGTSGGGAAFFQTTP